MTSKLYRILIVACAALAAAPVGAQDAAAPEREVRATDGDAEAIEVQLREAEEKLAEAAAKVAELSRRRLPDMTFVQRHLQRFNQPVLGVTIGPGERAGPVEGVIVRGVTPGSAAEEAGLRAGDVLTAINDESLGAATEAEANDRLLGFMSGVKAGDTLDVQYLREGDSRKVTVEPRPGFAWSGPGRDFGIPVAPLVPGARMFAFDFGGHWGDMEMVTLTEDLGRYFGTAEGLLVVRAPDDESLKLRDGDVIQGIDGREPTSASHAMRILTSYEPGETLEIRIMRDRKQETLSILMPDRRGSSRYFRFARPEPLAHPAPGAAPPAPASAVGDAERT